LASVRAETSWSRRRFRLACTAATATSRCPPASRRLSRFYPPQLGVSPMRRLTTAALLLLLASGCAGGPASPSPSPTTGFALRAWISQALPPVGAFRTAGPDLAIDQGRLILHGPEMAIYPGRLLPNLQQRPL